MSYDPNAPNRFTTDGSGMYGDEALELHNPARGDSLEDMQVLSVAAAPANQAKRWSEISFQPRLFPTEPEPKRPMIQLRAVLERNSGVLSYSLMPWPDYFKAAKLGIPGFTFDKIPRLTLDSLIDDDPDFHPNQLKIDELEL